MSAAVVPDEIAILAAQIERLDEIRAATNPALREAFKVLGPLVQDLPSTDVLIFSTPALAAWHALRDEDPELFICYRAAVRDRCGRHVASLLDERLARKNGQVARNVVAVEIGDLLSREFTPMEALLSPWLRKQNLFMIHAERGVGKTHFALNVTYAVAGGGSFLGWRAEKPRKVLYIDGEMPGAAIKERVTGIVASTPEGCEPPEGYFRIITPDVQDGPLPDLGTAEGQAAFAPLLGDAELIVTDNLSCLVRSGIENEGESWLPMADWALARRREGRAVGFVHHDGKGGTQRGTSRKEDILDVVIQLTHPKDYSPENGAQFVVHFKKSRGLFGKDVREIEAALTQDASGKQTWAHKEADGATFDRVIKLHALDMKPSEIAAELGVNRSTVSRHLKRARAEGQLSAGLGHG